MSLKASITQIFIFETFASWKNVESLLCLWAAPHLFGKNTFIFNFFKIILLGSLAFIDMFCALFKVEKYFEGRSTVKMKLDICY